MVHYYLTKGPRLLFVMSPGHKSSSLSAISPAPQLNYVTSETIRSFQVSLCKYLISFMNLLTAIILSKRCLRPDDVSDDETVYL